MWEELVEYQVSLLNKSFLMLLGKFWILQTVQFYKYVENLYVCMTICMCMQNGGECLRAFVSVSVEQLADW